MIEESEKLKILEEILQSPGFRDAKRYQDLLRFLVEGTLSGNTPKEITIGMQFFGKEASFDPREDPTVRVYINNLRKKLEHYYLTCDSPPTVKLEIPKGHYQVEFIRMAESGSLARPARKAPFLLAGVGLATLALGLVIGYFLFAEKGTRGAEHSTSTNPILAEFVRPGGRPTLVVLGDFFFLYERTREGQTGNFVRNFNINSPDDFKQMIKQDPDLAARFVPSDFTFLRPSATWGLAQILPVLQSSPNSYSLKLASQFTVDDLKANNVIFIGSFKTLYSLHKFLHIFGLEYGLSPNRFDIRGEQPDSIRTFLPKEIKGGNYEKDYAVVARGPGPDGSTILLLLGFADSGVIEASRAVMDEQVVTYITNKFAQAPLPHSYNFTLVVETEGFKQAIFKSDIRYFTTHHFSPQLPGRTQEDSTNTR